jgi:hypothetical protein
VITCPGIFPLILSILWRKQSRVAVIASAYLGLATGLAVWLGTAHNFYGAVTVASTGQTLPCMYGTVASAFSPLLYSVLITYLGPEDFDWTSLSKTSLAVKAVDAVSENIEDQAKSDGKTELSKKPQITEVNEGYEDAAQTTGRRWSRYALFWAIATFLGHWVLWPLPMYAAKFLFSKGVSDFQVRLKSHLLTISSFSSHGLSLLKSGCGLPC